MTFLYVFETRILEKLEIKKLIQSDKENIIRIFSIFKHFHRYSSGCNRYQLSHVDRSKKNLSGGSGDANNSSSVNLIHSLLACKYCLTCSS